MSEKQTILIIEDERAISNFISRALSANDYRSIPAYTGKEGLSLFFSHGPDLVLLDYEMPEENGAAVLRKIRENNKTRNIPVVFLTGITERGKIQEILALKIQGYLLKPIDMEKVSSTIKSVLGRR